ncbi:hypothetical protein ACP70R_011639 [Stipagrostis hirtigluma subsp. patula]
MEAAAKRARAGGDRLSALPDELLRGVLAFLPSRQAVQTTVLSKRWVELWRSVPAINLDLTDFRDPSLPLPSQKDWERMKEFTTDLLMFHDAECLDACQLKLYPSYCPQSALDWHDVERWIRRFIKYHPMVLKISVIRHMHTPFRIPGPSFTCRRLKRLELIGLHLDHSFTERLNSGCPVLEDLVLKNCHNEFGAIQSHTLKNLVVFHCESQVADMLVIKAPCLASLCLEFPHHSYKNGLSLEAGNSLASASISIQSDELSPRIEAIILGSLFNVTSLELEQCSAMAMLDKELDEFPTFDNLRTLSLDYCLLGEYDVHKFKALGRFLQKTPNLEKLTLKNLEVLPFVGPVEYATFENLRTLFLDECDLSDNFRLLRHCLRRSPNLEKLTVRLCKSQKFLWEGKERPSRGRHLCFVT